MIAKVIDDIFEATVPYVVEKRRPRFDYRARVDFDVLERAKLTIAELAAKAGDPYDVAAETGYPHFYFITDKPKGAGAYERLSLEGKKVKSFVDWLTPSDTADMADGEARPITLLEAERRTDVGGLADADRRDDLHAGRADGGRPACDDLAARAGGWLRGDRRCLRAAALPRCRARPGRGPGPREEDRG